MQQAGVQTYTKNMEDTEGQSKNSTNYGINHPFSVVHLAIMEGKNFLPEGATHFNPISNINPSKNAFWENVQYFQDTDLAAFKILYQLCENCRDELPADLHYMYSLQTTQIFVFKLAHSLLHGIGKSDHKFFANLSKRLEKISSAPPTPEESKNRAAIYDLYFELEIQKSGDRYNKWIRLKENERTQEALCNMLSDEPEGLEILPGDFSRTCKHLEISIPTAQSNRVKAVRKTPVKKPKKRKNAKVKKEAKKI